MVKHCDSGASASFDFGIGISLGGIALYSVIGAVWYIAEIAKVIHF